MRISCYFVGFMLVGVSGLRAQSPSPDQKSKTPDDLGTRLIREAGEDSSKRDSMSELIQTMGDVARKLQEEFDPGEQTQTQQREVVAKLDQAIKEAAARRQARTQSEPKATSDKRTMPASSKPQATQSPKKTGSQTADPSKPATSTGEAAPTRQQQETEIPKSRKGWGNLPDRDREEFLQGADEEYLERFRPWVEQYFKALQESNR